MVGPLMVQSQVLQAGQWPKPQMKVLNVVRESLENDAANQTRKYGGTDPSGGAARFNVSLPKSPQHDKYSWRPRSVGTPSSTDSGQDASVSSNSNNTLFNAGLRFNMHTLQKWFQSIDRDGSGVVTQRELIVAMRNQPGLLAMFCRIQGIESSVNSTATTHAEHVQEKRQEIYRIKEILSEVDSDGSGCMEWNEFVDFFRRAGLLLEYKERREFNRTSLCRQLEEQHAAEESARALAAEAAKNQEEKLSVKDVDEDDILPHEDLRQPSPLERRQSP